MNIEPIVDALRAKLSLSPPLGACYRFEVKGVGDIFLDARANPPRIEVGAQDDVDTTLIAAPDVFLGLMDGSQDPNMAFMMGKLKVKGSMGYAMKLNAVLAD
jgi:predicted lipid carrier protein YhbT